LQTIYINVLFPRNEITQTDNELRMVNGSKHLHGF